MLKLKPSWLNKNGEVMWEYFSVCCECQSWNKGTVLAHGRHDRRSRWGIRLSRKGRVEWEQIEHHGWVTISEQRDYLLVDFVVISFVLFLCWFMFCRGFVFIRDCGLLLDCFWLPSTPDCSSVRVPDRQVTRHYKDRDDREDKSLVGKSCTISFICSAVLLSTVSYKIFNS